MRFYKSDSRPSRITILLIAGFGLLAGALYFSFRDLQNDVKSEASLPVNHPEHHPSPAPDGSQAPLLQLPEESAQSANVSGSVAVPEATPGIDVAPPIGSEGSVPAVFGLLAQSNVTDLPMAEGLQGIAEEFTEKVKQGGWDTTSEAYRTNWEKAAQEADDTLRARYGTEIYMKLKQNAAP